MTTKVTVRRLPELTATPIPPGGGRITTPSGELTQVVNGEAFRYLAYLEFRPDASRGRGNHFHQVKTEHLYVISGLIRATYRDLDTDEEVSVDLTAGDAVAVAPRCAHTYLAIEHSHAVEFSPLHFDPTDTLPYTFPGH